MSMKRVLFVTSGTPYPLIDGGALRIYQDLLFLKKMGCSIDLVYVTNKEDEETVRNGLKPICENVYRYHISKLHSCWNVLLGFIKNKYPMQINYFFLPKVKKWIVENQSNYDLMFCIGARTAEYIRNCTSFKAIDYIDAVSLNYEKARHQKKNIWKLLYNIDYRLMSDYEKFLLDKFDIRITISETDRMAIVEGTDYQLDIVRNYYKINPEKYVEHKKDNHNIVFVGSMFYDPNVVAAVYFVKEVFPAILERYPDAKFYIVGNRPTKEVLNLASENVIVTGFVDDVWPYLKDSGVVVVPMQSGAGLQNKVLEALAIRACIVTTTTGTGGLVHDDGEPFIARNTEEMVMMIGDIFEMGIEQRQKITNKGFEYLKKYYSEKVVFESFKRLFINVL